MIPWLAWKNVYKVDSIQVANQNTRNMQLLRYAKNISATRNAISRCMSDLTYRDKIISQVKEELKTKQNKEMKRLKIEEKNKFIEQVQKTHIKKKDQKMLAVGIIGIPNTGKSTLMNYLVKEKISATSLKVQTTRVNTIGVLTENDTQIVFQDTPGLLSVRQRREIANTKTMLDHAWSTLKEANIVIILIDATKSIEEMRHVFMEFKFYNVEREGKDQIRVIGVINKMDLRTSDEIAELTEELGKTEAFDEIFRISAAKGYGVDELKKFLFSKALLSPWRFSKRTKTDLSREDRIREIIREKIYRRCNAEIPYQTDIVVTMCEDQPNGSLKVEVELSVPRKGHISILRGALPYIGERGKLEMQKIFAQEVFFDVNITHGESKKKEYDNDE